MPFCAAASFCATGRCAAPGETFFQGRRRGLAVKCGAADVRGVARGARPSTATRACNKRASTLGPPTRTHLLSFKHGICDFVGRLHAHAALLHASVDSVAGPGIRASRSAGRLFTGIRDSAARELRQAEPRFFFIRRFKEKLLCFNEDLDQKEIMEETRTVSCER